jgi:hypothetical protein
MRFPNERNSLGNPEKPPISQIRESEKLNRRTVALITLDPVEHHFFWRFQDDRAHNHSGYATSSEEHPPGRNITFLVRRRARIFICSTCGTAYPMNKNRQRESRFSRI